jgi:CDP-diacylglycerol---glycerol-3-phosphate 3-phosphatidyltransferase
LRNVKTLVRSASDPLARGLAAFGISANVLTLAGLLLNCLAGALVAMGILPLGGLLYLIFSCLDFLDGAVARLSGTTSPFGAFFDSVVDRASEAVMLVGLVYWFSAASEPLMAAVSTAVLVGSFLVSYARARAEGLGYECEVGWLQRPERIVLLGTGLILSPLHPALLPTVLTVLAVATSVTVVQRIVHVARLARANPSARRG